MTPFEFVAEQVVRARAWENQVYVAYINHDGRERTLEYVGRSSIVAPSGDVLAGAEHGDQLLLATIDTDVVSRARAENPYLIDRRLDLY
jgi:predicted amidohydrolase